MTILDPLLLVVVDEPGRERDALRTLLASMQSVRIVEILDKCSDLSLWMINRYPDVVIIRDRSMDEVCKNNLISIKKASPQSRLLVIADKSEQVEALMVAGMDQVFLRGFTSTELFTLLELWSMEKIMNYFSDEQKQFPIQRHSSYLEMMI
jgi:DNA-binding NarL/FixJ family response regulator